MKTKQEFKVLHAHMKDIVNCDTEQNEIIWQKKNVLKAFLDGYASRKRDRKSAKGKDEESKTTTVKVEVADKALAAAEHVSPITIVCCLACLFVKQLPLESLLFYGRGGTSFSRHKCVDQSPPELYAFNCANPCDQRYIPIEFAFKHDHPVGEDEYRVELEYSASDKRYYVRRLDSYILEDDETNLYDELVDKAKKNEFLLKV